MAIYSFSDKSVKNHRIKSLLLIRQIALGNIKDAMAKVKHDEAQVELINQELKELGYKG